MSGITDTGPRSPDRFTPGSLDGKLEGTTLWEVDIQLHGLQWSFGEQVGCTCVEALNCR